MPDESSIMSREAMDRKQIELHASILRAASKCLKDRSLDTLSVSDICALAGISRPTFYRFFSDKYDVFGWFVRTSMRSSLSHVGTVFSWEDALIRFFRVMDANRRTAYQFLSNEVPYRRFESYIERSLLRNIKLHLGDCDEVPYRYSFQARAFSRSFTGAVLDWLQQDDPPYSMVDLTISIIPTTIYDLLKNTADGKEANIHDVRDTDEAMLIEFVSEDDLDEP